MFTRGLQVQIYYLYPKFEVYNRILRYYHPALCSMHSKYMQNHKHQIGRFFKHANCDRNLDISGRISEICQQSVYSYIFEFLLKSTLYNDMQLISQDIRRAEREYININTAIIIAPAIAIVLRTGPSFSVPQKLNQASTHVFVFSFKSLNFC